MSKRHPSPTVGLRTVFRQLASQPGVVVTVLALVLVAALGLSVLPRTLENASREDLRQTLTSSLPAPRNIAVTQRYVHRPGSDPFGPARQWAERFMESQGPPQLGEVIDSSDLVATSPNFEVLELPGGPERPAEQVFFELRHQDAVWDQLEVTEGRLPERGGQVNLHFPCPEEEQECPPVSLGVVEVAVTAQTAEEAHVSVGDRVLLVPTTSGTTWNEVPLDALGQIRLVMEVTGIVELTDPELDLWFGDRRLHFPREVFVDLDVQWTEATGLISPDAFADVLAATADGPPWWNYEYRFFIDPDGVAAIDYVDLGTELTRFRIAHTTTQSGTQAARVATSLPELIDLHVAQREQTLRLMALTVAGIVATITFALLALGVLSTERQRNQVVLSRDRGASAPQVLMTRLYQAIALTALPIAAAYVAAAAILPGTDGLTPYAMAVALAVTAALAFVAPVWGLARRPLGAIRAEVTWPLPRNPRRVVLEVLLILVAAACVFMVRRRDPAAATGLDWLLVATPAVVGAAVGVITVRLVGPLSSMMSWFASRGSGAVSFVALRGVVQQPARVRTPLAVLVVCMATATLSLVLTRSIAEGQLDGSWQTVGADFVVTNSDLPLPAAVLDVEGGEVVHAALFTTRARFDNQRMNATVMAVDAARHEEVFGETPGAAGYDRLVTPTANGAIPAIVSTTWTQRLRPFVGAVVTLPVGDLELDVEIVGLVDVRSGLQPPFVILDRGTLEEAAGTSLAPTHALYRGPRSFASVLEEVVTASGAAMTARYEVLDRLAADPMVRWATLGMWAGAVLAGVVGVVSMIASFVIGAARRRQDLGYLRTMGLTSAQATRMTLVEQVPGVTLAVALGLVAGAVTAIAIRPAIDLAPFTGNRATPLTIDWPALALLLVAALALLTATAVIFVLVNRRQDLGQVLRVGDR